MDGVRIGGMMTALTANEWGLCYQAVRRYPVPATQGDLDEQGELWQSLKDVVVGERGVINRGGPEVVIEREWEGRMVQRLKDILGDRQRQGWTTEAWFDAILPLLGKL